MKIQKHPFKNGVDIFSIDASKFKTSTISIYLYCPLNKETVTENALLPFVLRQGTGTLKTAKEISTYLEEMYGASFDCGIRKKGENQVISFNISFVSDKYLPQKENLSKKALEFMAELVLNPHLENGSFKDSYVEIEKANLKDYILGLINDKKEYAMERCLAEMCKDEPYGIYQFGYADEIDNITPQSLYKRYQEVLKTAKIDIFYSGDVELYDVEQAFAGIDSIKREGLYGYFSSDNTKIPEKINKVCDKLSVTQGKLTIGYRIKNTDFYALAVANSIFGGGPHSKLFNNVREKLSLAYYVFSRVDRLKSIMVVSAGVALDSFKKAYDEICNQLNLVKNCDFSEDELNSAKKYYINALNSIRDSVFQYEDFYINQLLAGETLTIEQFADKIAGVTREDIKNAINCVALDTIYYLTGNEGADNEDM